MSELSDPQYEPQKHLGFFLSVLRPPNMFKLCLLKNVSKLVLTTNAMLSALKLPKQDFIKEKEKEM